MSSGGHMNAAQHNERRQSAGAVIGQRLSGRRRRSGPSACPTPAQRRQPSAPLRSTIWLTLFAVAVRALLLVHCAPAPPPALRPPSASNSVAVRVTRHPASRTPASFVRRHVASTA